VRLIVIHAISLPPGEFGGDHVQALFTNRLDGNAHPYFESLRGLKVSAHFYIQRDGALWQFAGCDDRAWHAGASSHRGAENCNDYSIGIELEGLEGGLFEDAQYETLSSLCAALADRYPVTDAAGHEHIAPGRKRDPGPGFDWDRLHRALGWPRACFPGPAPA
jgi:AmpD protein